MLPFTEGTLVAVSPWVGGGRRYRRHTTHYCPWATCDTLGCRAHLPPPGPALRAALPGALSSSNTPWTCPFCLPKAHFFPVGPCGRPSRLLLSILYYYHPRALLPRAQAATALRALLHVPSPPWLCSPGGTPFTPWAALVPFLLGVPFTLPMGLPHPPSKVWLKKIYISMCFP